MDYIHEQITINGRLISVVDICSGNEITFSEAEGSACEFIRDWLLGVSTFEMQTSGSTGTPRKITFRRDQLEASARISIREFGLDEKEKETSLICLPTGFVAGKMMLARALLAQMRIMILDPVSNPVAKLPVKPICFASMVPTQVHCALEAGLDEKINSIETLLIGGMSTGTTLRSQIKTRITSAVFFSYGMTETLTHVALERPGDEEGVFTSFPEVRLSTDHRGCLVIEASHLDAPVVTNDLVELVDDNRFRLKGRVDLVINQGGIKISPELLEEKLEQLFQRLNIQNRFFISSETDSKWGEAVILIMEGSDLPEKQMELLKSGLSSALERSEIPKKIVFVPSLSFTATGKIDRLATLKSASPKAGSK